jgi:hypothetical protein
MGVRRLQNRYLVCYHLNLYLLHSSQVYCLQNCLNRYLHLRPSYRYRLLKDSGQVFDNLI